MYLTTGDMDSYRRQIAILLGEENAEVHPVRWVEDRLVSE
jgi:hypothetical protein